MQIVIPSAQVDRKNDALVYSIGKEHAVTAPGAIVSTKIETVHPEEIFVPGLNLFLVSLDRLTVVSNSHELIGNGSDDKCYISSSFEGTSF